MIKYLHIFNDTLVFKNILIIGILIRISLFILLLFFPFPYGAGAPISPLHYQTGIDLAFYEPGQYYAADFNLYREILSEIKNSFFGIGPSRPFPGPAFPFIIWLTNYSNGNTLLLSTIIVIAEIISFSIWCNIMKANLVGYKGLFFCLMPHTIWFGTIVASDIFLYLFSTILFYFWHLNNKKYESTIFSLCAIVTMFRPAGLAILLARQITVFREHGPTKLKKYHFLYLLLLVLGIIYFTPYFAYEKKVVLEIHKLPFSLNNIFYKFFDIFGFQKSRTNLTIAYVIRYAYGAVFLLGFIGVLFSNNQFKLPVIITLFSVVVFLFPTWRYLLPILPILYFSGVKLIDDTIRYAVGVKDRT